MPPDRNTSRPLPSQKQRNARAIIATMEKWWALRQQQIARQVEAEILYGTPPME